MSNEEVPAAQPSSTSSGLAIAKRIATLHVPLWLFGAVVLVLVIGFSVLYFGKSTTSLGNAVSDARSIEVQLTICNETVDERGINPRTAELNLQKTFENDFDVEDAKVSIDRIDCDDDNN